jgi:hypothetical protein
VSAERADSVGKNSQAGQPPGRKTRKGAAMGRIIKALVVLVVLGFIGLTGYAYLGDLAPKQAEVKKPVVLNAD